MGLSKSLLFKNLSQEEINKAIKCLQIEKIDLKKDDLYSSEQEDTMVAIVDQGLVDFIEIDEDGNKNILYRHGSYDSFLIDSSKSNLKAVLAQDPTSLYLAKVPEIYNPNKKSCQIRSKIMENLILILKDENKKLNKKINLYASNSLREKIIIYLKDLKEDLGSNVIHLPFNREDMSNYLSCNRSALSRELSRMEKDKLIKVDKDKVQLLK